MVTIALNAALEAFVSDFSRILSKSKLTSLDTPRSGSLYTIF